MLLPSGGMENVLFGRAMQRPLRADAKRMTACFVCGVGAFEQRVAAEAGRALRTLLRQSTRLHALVAWPAVIGMAVLAGPFLKIWLPAEFESYSRAVPQTVVLTRILLIGLGIMCISDNWMRILYGAGQIRRYAPLVRRAERDPLAPSPFFISRAML